jgi:membrane protein YqaA with SNARE-associated domain
MQFLLIAAVVFGVNLLPAFGPPTWAVLVFFRLHEHANPVLLIAVGALTAASGRMILGFASRKLGRHLSPSRRAGLAEARTVLLSRRRSAIVALALFAVSPLPSAQLFMAAGMLDVKLVPLTAAFFAGRIVSYSIYVSVATIADKNLGSVLGQYLGSPLSIAIQVVFLLLVALLPFLNWSKLLRRYARPVDPAPSDNSDLTNGARATGGTT